MEPSVTSSVEPVTDDMGLRNPEMERGPASFTRMEIPEVPRPPPVEIDEAARAELLKGFEDGVPGMEALMKALEGMKTMSEDLTSLVKDAMSNSPKAEFAAANEHLRACCEAGSTAFMPPHRLQGKTVKYGALDCYENVNGSGARCVIVGYDIFGFDIGNTRSNVNTLAEVMENTRVIMPASSPRVPLEGGSPFFFGASSRRDRESTHSPRAPRLMSARRWRHSSRTFTAAQARARSGRSRPRRSARSSTLTDRTNRRSGISSL